MLDKPPLLLNNDFRHALDVLETYPDSFDLRSVAVSALCAVGDMEKAVAQIDAQVGKQRRRQLRAQCERQGGNPYPE